VYLKTLGVRDEARRHGRALELVNACELYGREVSDVMSSVHESQCLLCRPFRPGQPGYFRTRCRCNFHCGTYVVAACWIDC
jgi:hypothetical protein